MSDKQCPFCGNTILANAIKCQFCKEFLDGRQNSAIQQPPPQQVVVQQPGTVQCPKCKNHVVPHVSAEASMIQGAITTCPICTSVIKKAGKGTCCFVATCVFEGEAAPEVLALSRFRDEVLLDYSAGRAFVWTYEHVGPHMASWVDSHPVLKPPLRRALRAIARLSSNIQ